MSPRLVSFLSDFERALSAGDAPPSDAVWQSTRTVNNGLGLARMHLSVRYTPDRMESRGAVQLQAHRLVDGSVCLTAFLSWSGRERESAHAIYDRPNLDWSDEARRLAAAWIIGRSAAEKRPDVAHEPLAAAV